MPKSMTLTEPPRVTMTLPGLMSRCTMPFEWLYSRADRTPIMMRQASSALTFFSSLRISRSVCPSTNSMTM